MYPFCPGTSTLDIITTSVTAPPLEDSDGVADFLPDLSDRMSEFDNNNIDAEDNFDALGMMETMPAAAKASAKDKPKSEKSASDTNVTVDSVTSDASPISSSSAASMASSGSSEETSSSSTQKLQESDTETKTRGDSTANAERKNFQQVQSEAVSPHSVLRNRKTHTDVDRVELTTSTTTSVNASGRADAMRIHSSSQHTHTFHCSGHDTTSAINNTATGTAYTSSTTATTTKTIEASFIEEEEEVVVGLDPTEEERINQAQQRLAQNLQQVNYCVKY